MTITQILIGLNLLSNGFIAGGYFNDNAGRGDKGERLYMFVATLFLLIMGAELTILTLIFGYVADFIGWIGSITQVAFYWQRIVQRKWKEVTPHHWKVLDDRYEVFSNPKHKPTLAQRHFLHIVKNLHKKFNHTPKTGEQYRKEQQEKDKSEYFNCQWDKYPKDTQLCDIEVCKSCGMLKSPKEDNEDSCYWCGERYDGKKFGEV